MISKSLKRKAVATASVLGLTRRGVFVPHRYAAVLQPPDRYPELEALFAAAGPAMKAVLATIDRHAEIVDRFDRTSPPMPRWQQDWFPGLDGAAAYALIRRHKPSRILEVGSGHSTRFLARAVADGGFPCEIVCIDPQPRADLGALDVTLVRQPFQEVEPATLPALGPGDVLFIDSSHLALPGSDVDLLFGRLLPAVPAGVLVHVHDVFLPDAYPAAWSWRAYSEHQVVAAWLAAGGLEPVFASHFVRSRMSADLANSAAGRIPHSATAPESSLWALKRAPAR